MHSLFQNCEFRRLKVDGTNYVLAAGTSDVESEAVDMQGFEGVAFVTLCGSILAGGLITMKAQQSNDLAGSPDAYSDLAGTANAVSADTDDNKLLGVEIFRPKRRYVRAAITRGDGGNSTIDGLFAVLFRPGQMPVTQGATVEAFESFNTPAEGTA